MSEFTKWWELLKAQEEDGKQIERLSADGWNNNVITSRVINIEDMKLWRIKPESEYVPWTQETFPKDRLVWIREKQSHSGVELLIVSITPIAVFTCDGKKHTYENLLKYWVQHDGTPAGEKEKDDE